MNKTIKLRVPAAICALLFTQMACSPQKVDTAETMVSTAAPQSSHKVGLTMDQQVQMAIADLENRIDVAANIITVSQARAVNWGTSAVGCPADGMNYTQAIVPGILLLLEANNNIYHYHGRVGSDPFFCPTERAEAPAFGPGQAIM